MSVRSIEGWWIKLVFFYGWWIKRVFVPSRDGGLN